MSQPKKNPKLRRVAIVEDDSGLRNQLQRILESAPGVCCVGTFGSGEKALAGMADVQPDVILMDINLPGISGIECVAQLRKDLTAVNVIMLTVYEDSERIFQALQAGADGYLVKSSPTDVLLRAIEDVHLGGAPMSSHIARKVVRQFRQAEPCRDETANLAPREREVLNLLASGFVYKEIADQLGIGTETVKTYVKNICKKLHVRNRLEAVARFGHK
ncbi:MAG TPA: response regulator transcription factor [bacterium]|nr:response regulator transcription factor [bacterium]